jgi:hypothetical protein
MDRLECAVALDGELPLCDAKVAELHRYWRSIRPPGAVMPGRQHFDPASIVRMLPSVRLYDVHRDPWRFRYRLIGTELVRVLGRDPTGRWFDETVPAALASHYAEDLVFVASAQGVSYRRGFPVFSAPGKDHLTAERILLPLARDGRDVDIVLGFTVFHPSMQHSA